MPDDPVKHAAPLHPELGVIALVPEEWMPRWQTRHHVLARLARHFPTVWVNPPHDRAGVVARHRRGGPVWRQAEGAPALTVYTPPWWLPRLHRRSAPALALERARLNAVRRHLVQGGARRILLSAWQPEAADALDLVAHDAAVYHVTDEYSFSSEETPVPASERALLGRADATWFTSRALLTRKGPLARRAEFLPNGVEFAAFAAAGPEPADLARIPHPRVGYTGWLKRQLDWDLIETLAGSRPDVHFVFVGGLSPQPGLAERLEPLRRYPNVHFLGEKSSAELAGYPGHFDVCAMPYMVDGYTRYIYPIKLHEYLATGRPTMGTPIPALVEFAGAVRLAGGPGEWSAAIDALLSPGASSPESAARRQELARAHDWDVLTDRLAADLLAILGPG